MQLRPDPLSPAPPAFTFDDIEEEVDTDSSDSSPEIPISELPTPPTAWLPASSMSMYEHSPMEGLDSGIIKCPDCEKPIMASAVVEHATNCERIRTQGPVPIDQDIPSSLGTKRKADEITSDGPSGPVPAGKGISPPKKKKKVPTKKDLAKQAKPKKVKGPIDLDRQCGVFDEKKMAQCTRSITCKVHSMVAKRNLPGRSKDYDTLLTDWKRIHDPNFKEPVKKEPKKETKKAEREREREEKRQREIEAGILVVGPDGDLVRIKKKKVSGKKKKPLLDEHGNPIPVPPGEGGAGGGGSKKSNAARERERLAQAAKKALEAAGASEDEWDPDVDSEAEMEAMIGGVRAARRAGLAIPLAIAPDMPYTSASTSSTTGLNGSSTPSNSSGPSNSPDWSAGTWFVARNENLRCCADILRKALAPQGSSSAQGQGQGQMMGIQQGTRGIGGGSSLF